jgi:ABC-2 type transport system permease protein
MMDSTFWTLAKLQMKMGFGLSALRYYWAKRDRKIWSSLGIIALIVLGILPIFSLYIVVLNATFDAAVVLGQQQVVLTMAVVFSTVLVFFLGIVFVASTFFFSDDLPFLMSLPVKPQVVLGAKFVPVLASEYLTMVPFIVPALWVYGTRSQVGPGFWLAAVSVYALLPVVPLTLATVAVLFIMTATGAARKRDALRLAGMILLVAFALGFNYFLTRIPQGQEASFLQEVLRDPDGLSRRVSVIYPPALWATRAMVRGGVAALANLLGLASVAVVGAWVMMAVAHRVYFRSWVRGQEVQRSRQLSQTQVDRRLSRSSNPVWAIAAREIKILVRTPVFLFNSLAVLVIAPAALILPLISGDSLGTLLPLAANPEIRPTVVVAAAGFVAFMSIFTPALSSSVSREGRTFWISKVVPLDPVMQLQGKLLSGCLISSLTIALVVLTALVFPWTLADIIIISVVGMVASLPTLVVSLLLDLLRPYMDWDNPQRAIKQNINVLLGMVASVAILVPPGLAAYWGLRNDWPGMGIHAAIVVISVITGGVLYKAMTSIAGRMYLKVRV